MEEWFWDKLHSETISGKMLRILFAPVQMIAAALLLVAVVNSGGNMASLKNLPQRTRKHNLTCSCCELETAYDLNTAISQGWIKEWHSPSLGHSFGPACNHCAQFMSEGEAWEGFELGFFEQIKQIDDTNGRFLPSAELPTVQEFQEQPAYVRPAAAGNEAARQKLYDGAKILHKTLGELTIRVTITPTSNPPEWWEAINKDGRRAAPGAFSERELHFHLRGYARPFPVPYQFV